LLYTDIFEEIYTESIANGDRAQTVTRLPVPTSNIDPSLATTPTLSQTPTPTIPPRERSRSLYPNKKMKTEKSEIEEQLDGVQCAIRDLVRARNPVGVAIALLQKVYKPLLEEDYIDIVLKLLKDKKKANTFNTLVRLRIV